MTQRVFNFSAGPSTVPLSALEHAQRELVSLPGLGRSVLEISHRSKEFEAIVARAEANFRQLLGVPANYDILFLHGGGRMQFSMVPMNLLRGSGKSADYIVTGSWGVKAYEQAQLEGPARAAWDGSSGNYSRVPNQGELVLDSQAAYVHYTSNETIEGVQFKYLPEVGSVPLVCDASSDFISAPMPVEKFGLIYAGAQKNAGVAGVAIVIVRKDLYDGIPKGLPQMLDYRVHAKEHSLFNTPPAFAIYFAMLVSQWVLDTFGTLDKVAAFNQQKADLLYAAIDGSNGYYRPHADGGCRSTMNVTWRLPDEAAEKKFAVEAEQRGLVDLKGHRSVGGIRASIYNAMPMAGVEALVAFMEEFRARG
jgi:phosphoserine aminotransferase